MTKIKTNQPVYREAVLRETSTEVKDDRVHEFVISDESPDTYGTVFRMSGWKLDRYNANPIVVYAHRTWSGEPDHIIGTGEVFVEGDKLIGRVRYESAETNAFAEKIFQKVKNGTLRMASIGANPLKGHWGDEKLGEDRDLIYFDEQELLEWSIVPLGSNPEALKRSAESMEAIRSEMVKDIEITGGVTVLRNIRERQLNFNLKRDLK